MQPAKFEKTVTDDEKLTADDRAEIEHFTALMRAFGLISGDVDLYKAFKDAYGGGTLAYYSFEDKRISVRGETLSPAVRPTLVHELTHALQDQYFDIGDRMKKLDKESEKGPSTSESSVLQAINEGDAERVATLYRGTLTAAQRKELAASEKAQSDRGGHPPQGRPEGRPHDGRLAVRAGPGPGRDRRCRRWQRQGRQAVPQPADPRERPARSLPRARRRRRRDQGGDPEAGGGREEVRLRRAGRAHLVPDARPATSAARGARRGGRLGRRRLRRLRSRQDLVRPDRLRGADPRGHHPDALRAPAVGRPRAGFACDRSARRRARALRVVRPGQDRPDRQGRVRERALPGGDPGGARCRLPPRRCAGAGGPLCCRQARGLLPGEQAVGPERSAPTTRPSSRGSSGSSPAAADPVRSGTATRRDATGGRSPHAAGRPRVAARARSRARARAASPTAASLPGNAGCPAS